MKKILLIEDEDSIRKIIAYDLLRAGYEVEEASDGKDALTLGLNNKYDLMIIDWMLPNIDGIELIKKFRKEDIDSVFMVLTAKDDESDLLQAFEAGADDYMSKPFSPRELMARVNAHLKRASKNTDIKRYKDVEINEQKRRASIANKECSLTKKEYDLLEYFIINHDIVLSRDQILNDLWGFDYDGDTRIVDVHIFKLRNKLKNSMVCINSSRGIGYVMEEKNEKGKN